MPRPQQPHNRGGGYFSPALPRLFAHRGLALDAPENTLLAFAKALVAGATYLETDVHASRDGIAILSHDPDLSRMAQRDTLISHLSAAELGRIDLGYGQSYQSLAEALDAFPEARFNVDVKARDAVLPTVTAIQRAGATDRVLVTSFSDARRRAVVGQLPGVATSASAGVFAEALATTTVGLRPLTRILLRGIGAVQIPERWGRVPLVTRRLIRALHAVDVEVHVWTVNESSDMRRLLDMGVDGLVTDRVDVAVELLRKYH